MQLVPSPTDRIGRKRLFFIVLFAVNFLAFLFHVLRDGTSAFPPGGALRGDHYLVISRGQEISFTPAAYWFSYAHGILFLVSFLCILWLWHLRRRADRASDATI